MKINKATKKDASLLAEIDYTCECPVVCRLGIGKRELRKDVERRLSEENKEIYLFEDKGYVVLKTEFPGHNNCELYWLAVKKEFHGKGIGRKLVEFIETRAKKLGFRNIYLYTSKQGNKKAIGFYRDFGYKQINIMPEYYSDGSEALMMGKKLR